MDYAFLLCFDKDTESQFKGIIESIAESGLNRYMIDAKIPPHISIACFSTDDVEPIIHELDGHISSFRAGNIVWPSLGMFVPHVLFAAPIMDEYLLGACININRLIEPFSTVGERGFYLPYQWVPHTTLALQLDEDGLKKATGITLEQFSFITGRSNRLKLVAYNYNSYKEIKTWDLV